MRKRKLVAAMMACALTVSIYSPVQAAGYCINSNGSCPQIVVGGNCLGGNTVKDILSNSSCNNGNCVKGASDNSNCSNGDCTNVNNSCNIINGGSCDNSGNSCSVKSGNDCSKNGNASTIVIGGSSASCNNAAEILQKYITGNGSCGTQSNDYIIRYGNSCQPVTKNNSTSQSVIQDKTTEQSTTQTTTERVTTEQPATQTTTERVTTEQPATQITTERVTTEQPVTENEKTTEVITPSESKTEDTTVNAMSEDQASAAGQVLDLVNQNRSSAGLHSLRLDAALCAAAQIRANEIVSSFSHTRPDGRKFSTVLTDNGIRFTAAGENIAWGQTSPSQVMNAWMNSDGHRANIMNATYTKLGVGHVTVAGRQYWVQLFSY